MRTDIAKVVTERPRHGRGHAITKKYGGRIKVHSDPGHLYENEVGGFHSSARRRQINYKEFSDSLNIIEGNLRKNIGRPWDLVHSEFCAVMDRRGVSGYHVYAQHLMRDVNRNVYMGVDGKVYEYGAGIVDDRQTYDYKAKKWVPNPKGRFWIHHDQEVTGYYVHPITGLLCHNPYKGYRDPYSIYRKQTPKPINYIGLRDGVMYVNARLDLNNIYSRPGWKRDVEYYQLEECGRSPRNRFEAWFHYYTKTITKVSWEPIGFVIAKNAHFTGEVINKVSPSMELYYRARPEQYTKKEDGWWYRKTETTTKTTKRSCTREQIAQINKYLNRV